MSYLKNRINYYQSQTIENEDLKDSIVKYYIDMLAKQIVKTGNKEVTIHILNCPLIFKSNGVSYFINPYKFINTHKEKMEELFNKENVSIKYDTIENSDVVYLTIFSFIKKHSIQMINKLDLEKK